jgi:hypothetical protein
MSEPSMVTTHDPLEKYEKERRKLWKELQAGQEADYNGLSYEARQAFFALEDSGAATVGMRNGRKVVKQAFLARHPILNGFVLFATLGSAGYTRTEKHQ